MHTHRLEYEQKLWKIYEKNGSEIICLLKDGNKKREASKLLTAYLESLIEKMNKENNGSKYKHNVLTLLN